MGNLARIPDGETQLSTERSESWQRASEFAAESKAKATRRAYSADFKTFSAWCRNARTSNLPADPRDVAAFLSDRAREGNALATLCRNACGIGAAHVLAGFENPCKTPVVREVMKGIARTHGAPQNRKKPFLAELVRRVVNENLLGDDEQGRRDTALIALGFALSQRADSLSWLKLKHVSLEREGLRVLIARSKTDKKGEGHEIGIPRSSLACVALDRWLEVYGLASKEDVLFPRLDAAAQGSYARGLSQRTIGEIVKKAAVLCGEDPRGYGSHSLRAGFVTSAVLAGKDLSAIMAQTGHKSVKILMGYVRRASVFKANALEGVL